MRNHMLPRSIDPSLIEVGDTITVSLPPDKGVVTTLSGIVAKREDHGRTRYLYTDEGGTLLAWEPKSDRRVHVILIARQPAQQMPLEMFNETMQRLAG